MPKRAKTKEVKDITKSSNEKATKETEEQKSDSGKPTYTSKLKDSPVEATATSSLTAKARKKDEHKNTDDSVDSAGEEIAVESTAKTPEQSKDVKKVTAKATKDSGEVSGLDGRGGNAPEKSGVSKDEGEIEATQNVETSSGGVSAAKAVVADEHGESDLDANDEEMDTQLNSSKKGEQKPDTEKDTELPGKGDKDDDDSGSVVSNSSVLNEFLADSV